MTDDGRGDGNPRTTEAPPPLVSSEPAYAAWSRPASPVGDDGPVAHPLMPGAAAPVDGPDYTFEPGLPRAQQPPEPPPGWVGSWRPPLPPAPTADPSTWPQQGVAPGAGPHVGAWAIRDRSGDTVPDDRT